jgi:hypothetical protein
MFIVHWSIAYTFITFDFVEGYRQKWATFEMTRMVRNNAKRTLRGSKLETKADTLPRPPLLTPIAAEVLRIIQVQWFRSSVTGNISTESCIQLESPFQIWFSLWHFQLCYLSTKAKNARKSVDHCHDSLLEFEHGIMWLWQTNSGALPSNGFHVHTEYRSEWETNTVSHLTWEPPWWHASAAAT